MATYLLPQVNDSTSAAMVQQLQQASADLQDALDRYNATIQPLAVGSNAPTDAIGSGTYVDADTGDIYVKQGN